MQLRLTRLAVLLTFCLTLLMQQWLFNKPATATLLLIPQPTSNQSGTVILSQKPLVEPVQQQATSLRI